MRAVLTVAKILNIWAGVGGKGDLHMIMIIRVKYDRQTQRGSHAMMQHEPMLLVVSSWSTGADEVMYALGDLNAPGLQEAKENQYHVSNRPAPL
jgi:hypothetical protein